jgi:ATP-dependent DNA helicase PIF1
MDTDSDSVDLFDGLAEAQARALRMCIEGRSFFLTGSAGTGKSEVVRRMSKYLEDRGKS